MNIPEYLWNTPPRDVYLFLRRRWSKKHVCDYFDSDYPCIFVLSTGRVGTKTLASLLSLSSNLIAQHEPVPLLYAISRACYQDDIAEPDNIQGEAFKSLRSGLFNISLQSGKGYAETSPQSTFLAPIITSVIPEVRFIHLVRHPAEVVRSGMRREWYNGHQADATRIVPRESDSYYTQWQAFSQLQKNIWLWAETNRWISDFLSVLPDDRRLVLRSEDIFSRDSVALNKLYDFSSSEVPSSRRIQKVLSRKLNCQNQGDFPRLKEWASSDISELDRIAGDVMKDFDYSLK
jgi:Sulfotransferase family